MANQYIFKFITRKIDHLYIKYYDIGDNIYSNMSHVIFFFFFVQEKIMEIYCYFFLSSSLFLFCGTFIDFV